MKKLVDGQGYILKHQVTIKESDHYESFSSVYLLDPNPNTYWDSSSKTPRFVEFTFENTVSISEYSIKMSYFRNFIRSWDVFGTFKSNEFLIHSMPSNTIFQKPSQYESFSLNKSYKVDKVKLVFNSVTNNNAAYIANIDFLVDEGTFLQCNSLNFDKFRILIAIFIYYMN